MDSETKLTRPAPYPEEFLFFLQDKLTTSIKAVMTACGCPREAISAVDEIAFVEILLRFKSNPDDWRPFGRQGYEDEIKFTVQDIAWKVKELDDFVSDRVRTGSAAERSDGLHFESGWRA